MKHSHTALTAAIAACALILAVVTLATELGLQGGTCDARYLADGLVLVCHA